MLKLTIFRGVGVYNTMDEYIIHPLRLGTITRPLNRMSYGAAEDSIDFPIIAYYLSGKNNILVDTGGTAPDGISWMPYRRKENETLEKALMALGVKLNEIDFVILTHFHWDHAGAVNLFDGKKIFAQRCEYEYLLTSGEKPGYELEIIFAVDYELLTGDADIANGVSVFLTPGHTMGMQCVAVNTVEGEYLICSDQIPLFSNWEAAEPIINGNGSDFAAMKTSMKKIKTKSKHNLILPGHDEEVFTRQGTYPRQSLLQTKL